MPYMMNANYMADYRLRTQVNKTYSHSMKKCSKCNKSKSTGQFKLSDVMCETCFRRAK